jgi:hypothetical protein
MNPQTPLAEHTRCEDPVQRNVKDVLHIRASGMDDPVAVADEMANIAARACPEP